MTATIIAFAKTTLFALTAACAVAGAEPKAPNDKQTQPSVQEDKHFCCDSVDLSGKGSGDGCTATSKELINSCRAVLYCGGNWGKDDGHVACL